MSNNTSLLDLKGVCKYLNIKKSRAYYLVFSKQIPHIKIGASLRFDPIKIDKWTKAKEIKAE